MNQKEKREQLLRYLMDETVEYRGAAIPEDEEEQRRALRGLMNIRMPNPVDPKILSIQDDYLQERNRERGIVRLEDLQPIRRISPIDHMMDVESVRRLRGGNAAPVSHGGAALYLWKGDITRLAADAIVNAANKGMTGCYQPNHSCIDNCIHTFAGMQLRLKCDEIMRRQGFMEKTGRCKITPAYNLPSQYVLHTVGPIIAGNEVTENDRLMLASCYRACLRVAALRGLESIAFCCISTGVFHFPNQEAAEIAVDTVKTFLREDSSVRYVIFNVFTDKDERIYRELINGNTRSNPQHVI